MMLILFTLDNEGKISKITAIEFDVLYQENKVRLYNFLIVKVNGDKNLAEDILSETIYSALLSYPKLKDKSKAVNWLFQIANRRFYDYLRKKYKDKKIIANKITEDLNKKDPEQDKSKNEEEKIAMLKTGMDNLKPKYKEIIKLKFIENKSQKDIAQIFSISVKSAESLIFRSREALKKEVNRLYKERLV